MAHGSRCGRRSRGRRGARGGLTWWHGSLANLTSLTPGGVGVNQAFNVASLYEATSAATAGGYSVGHQLLSTVWNIVLAAVLVAAAFGRSGGKRLVEESSARARELRPQGDDAALRGGASS